MLQSRLRTTALSSIGAQKLGHPVPESYFVSDLNSSAPHPAHRYVPASLTCTYIPVNGRSVPALRSTWNCSDVSLSRHSASLSVIFSVMRLSPPSSTADQHLHLYPPAAVTTHR